MSQGKPISIVPFATEVTTQKAAGILGCSRPYLVKLLEEGKIEFTKVGKHRRIRFEHDVFHGLIHFVNSTLKYLYSFLVFSF
jgi:excisionase family DNA binding protein